uniref:Uncharacterized protein n=1 Tax=Anguilla anguilla TaxID=7936 RepID=A0A0E9QPK9_ANGAN
MNKDFTKQIQDKREQKASQGSSSKKEQKVNPKIQKRVENRTWAETHGELISGGNTQGRNITRSTHNQTRILTCVCF